MRMHKNLRRFVAKITLPVVFLGAAAYFAHHALYDAQGWRHSTQLSRELTVAQDQLRGEQAKTAEIQGRVDGLKSRSLDPDLLDERARQSLGLAKPDEIIIYKPQ